MLHIHLPLVFFQNRSYFGGYYPSRCSLSHSLSRGGARLQFSLAIAGMLAAVSFAVFQQHSVAPVVHRTSRR